VYAATNLKLLRAFADEFLESMTRIQRAGQMKSVSFLPLTITTITLTGTYVIRGAPTIPVETLRNMEDVAAEFGLTFDEPRVKRKRKDAYTRDVVPDKRRFRNQLSVRRDGKSAKIFYNGSLHVTGCASVADFVDVADLIVQFVREGTGREGPEIELILSAFDIKMINAGTVIVDPANGFPVKFPPRALSGAAARFGVDFDSERHPGVKIPVYEDGVKVATTCVFQTGSMSIIGAKRPRHVALAFENAADVLEACAHVGEPTAIAMRTTTAKKKLDLVHGYPAASYFACATSACATSACATNDSTDSATSSHVGLDAM
jgi:TATA-box binding protein (TBP) (component of TFIID and TFIIIB)